jgi:DNA-directed RNA polymerase specialized sigma24 family protein
MKNKSEMAEIWLPDDEEHASLDLETIWKAAEICKICSDVDDWHLLVPLAEKPATIDSIEKNADSSRRIKDLLFEEWPVLVRSTKKGKKRSKSELTEEDRDLARSMKNMVIEQWRILIRATEKHTRKLMAKQEPELCRLVQELIESRRQSYLQAKCPKAAHTLLCACRKEVASQIQRKFGAILNDADQTDLQEFVLQKFLAKIDDWEGGSIPYWLKTATLNHYLDGLKRRDAQKRIPAELIASLDEPPLHDGSLGETDVLEPEVRFKIIRSESQFSPAEEALSTEDAELAKEPISKINTVLKNFAEEDPERWSIIHKIYIKRCSVWKLAKRLKLRARDLVTLVRSWCAVLTKRIYDLGLALPRCCQGLVIPTPIAT